MDPTQHHQHQYGQQPAHGACWPPPPPQTAAGAPSRYVFSSGVHKQSLGNRWQQQQYQHLDSHAPPHHFGNHHQQPPSQNLGHRPPRPYAAGGGSSGSRSYLEPSVLQRSTLHQHHHQQQGEASTEATVPNAGQLLSGSPMSVDCRPHAHQAPVLAAANRGPAAWQQHGNAREREMGGGNRVWISGGGGGFGPRSWHDWRMEGRAGGGGGGHGGERATATPNPTLRQAQQSYNKWAPTGGTNRSATKRTHHPPEQQQQQQTRKQGRRARQRHAKALRAQPPPPCGPPATAECMKALGLVAVSGMIGVSIGLEGACVDLSNACREGAPWLVKTGRWSEKIPLRLRQFWPLGGEDRRTLQLSPSRLIQRRMVKALTILHNDHIGEDFAWPVGVEKVNFKYCNKDLGDVKWPSTMTEVRLSWAFAQAVEHIVWPKSLRELDFGNYFNSPVEGVDFPDGLERIQFSRCFNQPIAEVKWPSRLLVLKFGEKFNRPLNGVIWPDTLKYLDLMGQDFNQPLHVAPLPRDLAVLMLGDSFDQPLDTVAWPKGLLEVFIGHGFTGNESPRLADMVWPSGLRLMSAPRMNIGHLPKDCCREFVSDSDDDEFFEAPWLADEPWPLEFAGGGGVFGMGVLLDTDSD
ncbi:unnamed protein product [Ectocarpus sp. 12 AP-2014]